MSLDERRGPAGEGGPEAEAEGVAGGQGPDRLLSGVMREIDEEVRRRRASGEFPPSTERRLDRLFSRFVPVGVVDEHFAETLKLADRSAYIDIEVPTASEKRGVGPLKRFLRQLMAWYLNYVVQQLTHFTSATMRVLHMLDERVAGLEEEVDAARAAPFDEDDLPDTSALGPWAARLRERLAGHRGRVLVGECGTGELVTALVAEGVNAYGVDPRASVLDGAAAAGVDVRCESVLDHLRSVASGGLGGLVLNGCVERLAVREQRELVSLAADKVATAGLVAIASAGPEHWATRTPAVQRDLAPGRPLHPETWCRLLARSGFAQCEVECAGPDAVLEPVPGTDPAAKVINANLVRLNEVVFGPESYLVIATRPPAAAPAQS